MNMMQLAAYATASPGLNRTTGQFGGNRNQTSKTNQAGKEDFSKIFERSRDEESPVRDNHAARVNDSGNRKQIKETPASNNDTQPRTIKEGRTGTETVDKRDAGDNAKLENDSAADKSASDKSTADQAVQGVDISRQEFLSQLAELLQLLGFTITDENNGGTPVETGGGQQDGQSQAAAMLNLNRLNLDQTELRQILTQLIDILNKQGDLPKGLSELKVTETGLSMNNEIPLPVFLNKLLEAAKEAAQPAVETEKSTIIPLEVTVAKSAPVAANLKGHVTKAAAETVEDASDEMSKVLKDTTESSPENARNSGRGSSYDNFNQNADDQSKDAKVVASGLKSPNNNVQNNSAPLYENGSDLTAKFSVQPESPVNGPLAGQASQSEAATMPRMTQLIFSQIAQKAKLVVAPGTTEMQIQLKPDFLGRLNLNISTDNGLVTAKFTAESHAVKGIIEANLNSLKDSLAQQGVKVDQLVVDVGTQHHQSGFENRQSFYGNGHTRKNHVSVSNQELENMFSNEVQAGAIKDYYGSTVEYTA